MLVLKKTVEDAPIGAVVNGLESDIYLIFRHEAMSKMTPAGPRGLRILKKYKLTNPCG